MNKPSFGDLVKGRFTYDKLAVFCFPKRRLMDWRDERGNFLSALREGGVPLELLNRSEIIRRVVAHDNGNGTMLRRSAQFLLALENDHFEGSMLLAPTKSQKKVPHLSAQHSTRISLLP